MLMIWCCLFSHEELNLVWIFDPHNRDIPHCFSEFCQYFNSIKVNAEEVPSSKHTKQNERSIFRAISEIVENSVLIPKPKFTKRLSNKTQIAGRQLKHFLSVV